MNAVMPAHVAGLLFAAHVALLYGLGVVRFWQWMLS